MQKKHKKNSMLKNKVYGLTRIFRGEYRIF